VEKDRPPVLLVFANQQNRRSVMHRDRRTGTTGEIENAGREAGEEARVGAGGVEAEGKRSDLILKDGEKCHHGTNKASMRLRKSTFQERKKPISIQNR